MLRDAQLSERRIWSVVLFLLAVGISACGGGPGTESVRRYVLPGEMTLKAEFRRGPEGEGLITGSTNFPDGFKLWVHIESGRLPLGASKVIAGDDKVVVRDGMFRTTPLWVEAPNKDFKNFTPEMKEWPDAASFKFRRRPLAAGKYNVHFIAYFTGGNWQERPVLELLGGDGGKTLHGSILKATDTDVVDSDKMLDHTVILTLAGLSPEAEAIALVKASVLSVPGKGRSAIDIEGTVNDFMKPGSGLRPSNGWSATPKGGQVYEVVFDYLDGKNPRQAVWSANLGARDVNYVNSNAKYMSWTPSY